MAGREILRPGLQGRLPGCLEPLRPPQSPPLPSPPPLLFPPGMGPAACRLTLLHWERCLLCPQLKVENHPASAFSLLVGGDLSASAAAGPTLGWGRSRRWASAGGAGGAAGLGPREHPPQVQVGAAPHTSHADSSHDLPCQESPSPSLRVTPLHAQGTFTLLPP